jgi:hypothetical protein
MLPLTPRGVISALFALLAFAMPARSRAEDPLLNEVKAGHRAARQAIRTFSATVTFTTELPALGNVGGGRYRRVGDTVHIQVGKEGVWTADNLVKGGEIRGVDRAKWSAGRPQLFGASRRPATDFLSGCDVWREMMLELAGPDGGQLPYDRVLEVARVSAASRRRKDGREYVIVPLAFTSSRGQESRAVPWHDVGCNYLIRKLEASYPGTETSGIVTVTEFAEPRPGVFFPVRCTREDLRDGKLRAVRVTSLTDVRVNEPIPPDSLSLPAIPSGTILYDTIDGTKGKVGADWRPIGPRRKAIGTLLTSPSAPAGGSAWEAPSSSEPDSPWWWVAALSGGGLALSLGYLLVRRLRGGRPVAT